MYNFCINIYFIKFINFLKLIEVTIKFTHFSCIPRSNVTPNAQESEDSGMSLSYTVLATDVAKRITPTASTPPNTITNNNSSQATNLNSSASQNGNSSGATSTHSDTNGSRNISSSNSHGNSYNDNNADMEGFRESAAPRGAAKHFRWVLRDITFDHWGKLHDKYENQKTKCVRVFMFCRNSSYDRIVFFA